METLNTLKVDLSYTRKGRDTPQRTHREEPPAAPHMRGERQEVEPHLASRDGEDGKRERERERGREIQERWEKAAVGEARVRFTAHNSWLHGVTAGVGEASTAHVVNVSSSSRAESALTAGP